jgi:hypothetical protein
VCLFYILSLSLKKLRREVSQDDAQYKQQQFDAGPKASEGYGGKFGVQKDRMDKVCANYISFRHQQLESVFTEWL